jgi:hypothetical protein
MILWLNPSPHNPVKQDKAECITDVIRLRGQLSADNLKDPYDRGSFICVPTANTEQKIGLSDCGGEGSFVVRKFKY